MSFSSRILQKMGEEGSKQIAKDMKTLEDHMITIQGNQCEQEAYHKETIEKLDLIIKKLENKK